MRILFLTAAKRVKKTFGRTFMLSVSLLFSTLLISGFLQASINIGSYSSGSVTEGEVNIQQFLDKILSGMSSVLAIVALIAILSIAVYISMVSDENKAFISSLESIGALRRQKYGILLIEAAMSYFPSILIGAASGTMIGNAISSRLLSSVYEDYSEFPPSVAFIAVSILGMILVLLITLLSSASRLPLIERLKNHNRKEIGERHSYRNSYTFKNMPIEKRLAKKSADYHKAATRRISLMIAATSMYTIIGFIFFYLLSDTRVIVDENPYDGIDTSAIATAAVESIMLFTLLALLALLIIGAIQITVMLKAQIRIKDKTVRLYKSVGMSDLSAKRLKRYEVSVMISSALLYAFVASAIVLVAFGT